MFCEDAPPGICFAARARHALGAPSFHHRLAIRLLIEADPYHVHAHVEAEYRTREGERGAPLPGAGLGGKSLDASVLVVKGLGYGSGGRGRSATMLYQSFGSRVSSSRYFTVSDIGLSPFQPLAGAFQTPRSCISRTWRSITSRLYSACRPGTLSM